MPKKEEGLPAEGDEPQDTLDPETPEDEPQEPTGEPTGEPAPGEPRKYAGKYKTIEDLEKAYEESEKRMHEATGEAAQYRTFIQQQIAQQQPTQQPAPDPSREIERFTQGPQQYIAQAVQGVIDPIQEQMQMQYAATNFKASHKDWEQYREGMLKVANEFPLPLTNPRSWDFYYEIAKSREIQKGIADAQKDAYEEGKKSAADKEAAKQTTPTSKPRAGAEPQKSKDEMTAEEFAESEGLEEGPDIADKPANF